MGDNVACVIDRRTVRFPRDARCLHKGEETRNCGGAGLLRFDQIIALYCLSVVPVWFLQLFSAPPDTIVLMPCTIPGSATAAQGRVIPSTADRLESNVRRGESVVEQRTTVNRTVRFP